MLRIHLLASGSSGNCALIEAGTGLDRVVVCLDCGIAQRTARGLAEAAGLSLTSLDAVLLTHRHSDHSANIVPVAARARAPLYAHTESLGTNRRTSWSEIRRRNVEVRGFDDRGFFQIGPLRITPIRLPHDAEPTFGFVFETDDHKAGFFTDLGRPEILMEAGLLDGMRTLVLESNHDREMLEHGPYPYMLRQRVGGDLGHLANVQTAEILAAAAPTSLERLVLAHLSMKNNTEELALSASLEALQGRGLRRVDVLVAPARGLLQTAPA
ncbi:MAG: MBL fold metallo-hydrolase [Planctomycetota bacterium]|jgi:phosphoribosyl 1,2-cyclic phosphodiesterase